VDDREAGAAPRRQEIVAGRRARIFPRTGDAQLPNGVGEKGAGAFVIRLVAPTPTEMEVANVAY